MLALGLIISRRVGVATAALVRLPRPRAVRVRAEEIVAEFR